MPANPIPVVIEDPVLLDLALFEIQQKLELAFDWLDTAYGKAEKRPRKVGEKEVNEPVIYAGDTSLIQMFPDEHLGNFSFFDIEEGEDISSAVSSRVIANFGLVIWFDYRLVFNEYSTQWQRKSIDHVKLLVINFFKDNYFNYSSVNLEKAYVTAEEIYKNYRESLYQGETSRALRQQYLQRPYGGVRLEGVIKCRGVVPC